MTEPRDTDATRVALAMVRADWQGDDATWNELWCVTEDASELARELTRLCREQLERLAGVAGVSTAEMLHRVAAQLIPHPEPGQVSMVDLERQHTGSHQP